MTGPVSIVVTLHVKPECEVEFLALLMPLLDAMRQEESFLDCALHRDPEDPTLLMLYENWADLDELAAVQMKRPYRAAYEARLPALLRTPRHARLWRPVRRDAARIDRAAAES